MKIFPHCYELWMAVVFLLLTTSLTAQRVRINIDEDWRFRLGHAADPQQDFQYGIPSLFAKSGKGAGTPVDPRFNDSSWRSLQLPHDWAVELPFVYKDDFDLQSHGYRPVGGLFPQNSIGWYRKRFNVPLPDSGNRFSLQFDGAFRNADFWLNGYYLGRNASGYTGVTWDITDYIHWGSENVVTVRVDASQYEGWFYEGAGIYRHVWLLQHAPVYLPAEELFVYSRLQGPAAATVTVEATLTNATGFVQQLQAEAELLERDGRPVVATDQPVTAPPYGNASFRLELPVQQPRRWSLDDPYLYRVRVRLRTPDGRVVDEQLFRFGIRSIEIRPNGVFLNGQHVKIKGVNNHQDHAGVGAALPDYLHYYRVRLTKELGANAWRSSHNAAAPELLDACDSLGLLVMDEQRLLNSSPEYLGQWEWLIKRGRNRACIFMWSIGNEEGWLQTTSVGKRIAQTLLQRQQALDPTRTSTYAADLPNVFHGINEVIPVRAFNYREYAVADYHRDHPQQPIIGTEMGSTVTTRGIYATDSVRGYLPDQDITFPWWASTAETWWKLCAPNDFWLGGFIWTGFDYRGEPTPFSWPNVNSHFGIMDVCGFPKNIYYYYQSWWTNRDVLHLSPHWNWPGKEGQVVDVWVNSNAQTVELFLNGKSLGKKNMPVNGHLRWQVIYRPGVLKAVAYKNGKRLEVSQVTTGPAHRLELTPDRTILNADGRDATVVNVTVVDRNGRPVPDANLPVQLELQGAGRIIGVGNGDPSCHEADVVLNGNWQRSLFNGKCQVILQTEKGEPGTVTLLARSEGLQTATLLLHTQ
ncbi:MAG TPA: beta-galactosidase GalA [Lacibacter sp.]|nr:beta-galactosidase GalA [Lacibacter sp.]HMO90268.1 beta-galactosidase GalA [Lacibacter sp.]